MVRLPRVFGAILGLFVGATFLALASFSIYLAVAGRAGAGDPAIEYRVEVPPGTKAGARLPAVMVFGGFETAAAALDLIHPPEPMVLASFDYPYRGPTRIRFPAILREAPKLKRAIHRTIDEIPRLHRHLRGHPAVDPERIVLLGASFGAPLAVYASARDPELRRLILIHGFGRVRAVLRSRIALALREKYGWGEWASDRVGALVGWVAWAYLDLPEVEDGARTLGRDAGSVDRGSDRRLAHSTLLVEATGDEFIPVAARDSLRRALAESGTRLDYRPMPGRHLGPGAEELIRELTDVAMAWLAKID